jgi:hypothetical protein
VTPRWQLSGLHEQPPSWALSDLQPKQRQSSGLVICRTGTAGSLALVESADSAAVGTGRTLSGVAAVFSAWQEIRDAGGHYFESISPRAFQKTLSESRGRIPAAARPRQASAARLDAARPAALAGRQCERASVRS